MTEQLIGILTPAIQTLAKAFLSVEMILIILAGMTLTWAIKVFIRWKHNPKNWLIVWVFAPFSSVIPAFLIWPEDWKHDLVVGIAASILSTTLWWLVVNKVGRKLKPDWVNQVNNPWSNTPWDRRKHNKGKIIKERRQRV